MHNCKNTIAHKCTDEYEIKPLMSMASLEDPHPHDLVSLMFSHSSLLLLGPMIRVQFISQSINQCCTLIAACTVDAFTVVVFPNSFISYC